jgi:hypothetical protein
MNMIRQALVPIIASVVTGCLVGYGSFAFGQGQLAERLNDIEHTTTELANNDREITLALQRIDREGTQVSRADKAAIDKLEIRLDRMESQQAMVLAQGARNEALLLDLKQRLRQ